MESWFHDSNPMSEVRSARHLIAKTITQVQTVFKRSKGKGWNLQKVHGLTKMQYCMCLFGSGYNFFGGPGEASHKVFVKNTGNNTQMRIGSFASQCAQRYYETLILELAKIISDKTKNRGYELITKRLDEQPAVGMQGKFKVEYAGGVVKCSHLKKDNRRKKCKVHEDYKNTLAAYLSENDQNSSTLTGYMCCQMNRDGRTETFRATSQFLNGDEWYDWCLVEFVVGRKKHSFPCRILGFVQCDTGMHAIVMSSTTPLSYAQLQKLFVVNIHANTNDRSNFCVVSVEAITHPLFVYHDYGSEDDDEESEDMEGSNSALDKDGDGGSERGKERQTGSYWCVLPERKWGRYFGDQIKKNAAGRLKGRRGGSHIQTQQK